jgi:transcriptional regulator of arginine metabolism
MNEHTKNLRQQILKRVITEQEIKDQNQLLDALKKEGIETTQATISRDLEEIGVIKARLKHGIYKYELQEKLPEDALINKLAVMFGNFVVSIKGTKNLILIKTAPGNANGVASLIDKLERKEILGTIAGDDTILVIIDADKNRAIVEREFIAILEYHR